MIVMLSKLFVRLHFRVFCLLNLDADEDTFLPKKAHEHKSQVSRKKAAKIDSIFIESNDDSDGVTHVEQPPRLNATFSFNS